MPKISVIIPMYNSQDTIDECLASLTGQTIFADIELILVDDNSTDDTVSHIMSFEKRYPGNILVIRLPENGGPGRARDIAMEYARGEYIGFVDSDDAVVPVMYERLYKEALRTGADVIDCGFINMAKDEAIVYTSDELTGVLDGHKRSELIVSGGYIWSKIYRRDFLVGESIRFREDYVLEDMDFIMEVFCKANTISNVKEILYVYRDRGGSLSKTIDVDKYIYSTTSAMEAIYDKLSGLPCYNMVREAVEYALLQLYSFSININLKAVKDGIRSREKVLASLESLRVLKSRIVCGGYDNRYVFEKIDAVDIQIMKSNDLSPLTLVNKGVYEG